MLARLRGLVPLTGRGVGVLVAAVVLVVAGIRAGYPLFTALAGIAFGALVAAFALTVRRPHVEVRRDLYPDRVERGRPALATLRVRNAGTRLQGALSAYDVAGDFRRRVRLRRLAPGAEATYRYELPTTRRGRLAVGPLVLERSDPLGLARRRVAAGGSTSLFVHPRRLPARTAVAGRPRHHHEGRTTDDSLHGSADLRDVRPYVVGDEVRHLHWKATARIGQLMVRDYVDPDQPRLAILVDTRAEVMSAARFEEAIEVAGSIVFSAAMAGHRCRLLTSEGLDLSPAAGPTAARLLLDALTELEQSGGVDALVPAVLTAGRGGGGAVVVVTGPDVGGPELAPLGSRYRSVRVVTIGPFSDTPSAPSARVRRIVAAGAEDAIRQWNLEA